MSASRSIVGDDELGVRGERARENAVIVGIACDARYVDGLGELDRFEVVDKDVRRSLADRSEALGERRTARDVAESPRATRSCRGAGRLAAGSPRAIDTACRATAVRRSPRSCRARAARDHFCSCCSRARRWARAALISALDLFVAHGLDAGGLERRRDGEQPIHSGTRPGLGGEEVDEVFDFRALLRRQGLELVEKGLVRCCSWDAALELSALDERIDNLDELAAFFGWQALNPVVQDGQCRHYPIRTVTAITAPKKQPLAARRPSPALAS